MTPDNFILWLRGFAKAVGDDDYPTAIQWDIIKEQLAKVKENGTYSVSVGVGGNITTNTTLGRNDVTYKTDVPTTK